MSANTPSGMDKEESLRVDRLRSSATVERVKFSENKNISRSKVYRHSGFTVGMKRLGYSSAIALGDAVRAHIVEQEEIRSNNGACRNVFVDGEPVPPEDQLLTKTAIKEKRALTRGDVLPRESRQ